MATANWYGRLQYTVNGQNRNIGSNVAPAQATYTGSVSESFGTLADSTVTQIFSSTGPGQDEVATWTKAVFLCDQDCRLLLRANNNSNTACWVISADTVTPISAYQIPEYNTDVPTYIANTLQAVTAIWAYQDSGETANWQLVLLD